MSEIDYPNNNNPSNLNKPNYSNQTVHDPSKTKSDRGYYGNDNTEHYYSNCNSGLGQNNKQAHPSFFPNSNKEGK